MESQVLKWDGLLESNQAKFNREVANTLEEAYSLVETDLLKSWTKHGADTVKLNSATRSLLIMQDIQASLWQFNNAPKAKKLAKSFGSLLGQTAENGIRLGEALLNTGAIPIVSNTKIDKDSIALSIQTFGSHLENYSKEFTQSLGTLIRASNAIGLSGKKTAGLLRAKLAITQNKAEMLVLTETARIQQDSLNATYETNGVEHVQWLATADRRACPYCASRHLKVYKKGEVAVFPIHPRDRCLLAPFDKMWLDEGLLDKEDLEKSHRAILEKTEGKEPNFGATGWEVGGAPKAAFSFDDLVNAKTTKQVASLPKGVVQKDELQEIFDRKVATPDGTEVTALPNYFEDPRAIPKAAKSSKLDIDRIDELDAALDPRVRLDGSLTRFDLDNYEDEYSGMVEVMTRKGFEGSDVVPTEQEISAAIGYSGTDFGAINSGLRGFRKLTNSRASQCNFLTSFMKRCLDDYVGTVYRGSDIDEALFKKYKVGAVIGDLGFHSTSKRLEKASEFLAGSIKDDGKVDVMYHYKVKSGKDLSKVSIYEKEDEVLMLPRTEFRITKMSYDGELDAYVVYAEEI